MPSSLSPIQLLVILGLTAPSLAFAQAQWVSEPMVGAGGTLAPAAALGGPHGMDLIYVNNKGELWWQWKNDQGGYRDPVNLSEVGATSGPGLAANGRHALDAFYRGPNSHLWTSSWDGQWWSGGTDLGGEELQEGTPILAVANTLHRLDVYYLNAAGQLTVSYWDGEWWSAPGHFPLTITKGFIALATSGPHKVELFYRGPNDRLYTVWSDGGPWSGERDMGFRVTSNPAVAQVRRMRRIDGSFVECTSTSPGLPWPCLDVSRLFFRNTRGELCWRDSAHHSDWHPIDTCAGVGVNEQIVAVSISEVITMGAYSPTARANIPSAVFRVFDPKPQTLLIDHH
jgi:hypothetical protein